MIISFAYYFKKSLQKDKHLALKTKISVGKISSNLTRDRLLSNLIIALVYLSQFNKSEFLLKR